MAGAKDHGLVHLDEEAVRSVLDMDALIAAMEAALIDYSAGRIEQPDRRIMPVAPHGGFFAAMSAVGTGVGVKLVTAYPGNAERGIPTHQALIVLFEPETGTPLATMDGRLITEMRTAAVSAVATRVLSAADARVLAVLGTGVQARVHVDALSHVRRFNEIRIWGRSADKAAALAAEVGGHAMAAEAAMRGADVIVTATSAMEPVLSGEWLKPGAHVNAVGWNTSEGRELDDAAMRNLVIVETRSGAANDSGNIRRSGAEVYAEIGEVLAGDKPVDAAVTTIFDSVGMAAEDVAAATLVWDAWRGGPP